MTRPKEIHPPGSTILMIILICGLLGLSWSVLHQRPIDEELAEDPWPDMRIDVNSAPAAHLQVLPGIGPRLAERIVAYREEHGPFTNLDDLQQIKFIGPSVISRIEPYVVVLPPNNLSNRTLQESNVDN